MKAQRRRFVVEVKRGTSRASFISTDAAAEKFSSAEDALFGPKAKPAAVPEADAEAPSAMPMGRVLRDLQEPPPPPMPELPQPARRGRKPGSKNKPKLLLETIPAARTPRKMPPTWAEAVASQFPDPGSEARSQPDLPSHEPGAGVSPSSVRSIPTTGRGSRLRDRSTILKRYVLGTEPAPGQTGWTRGLRSKRRG